ncbi:YolD-like protein [Bacillus subtilis subsp. subtilis]|nr:YolD-like protein [Bacillus subtilis subsp. subtilis]
MMLPEHLTQLKKDLIDVSKIEKPALDDQQIEEMGILVSEALELNKELNFKLFNNGFVEMSSAESITLILNNKSFTEKTRRTIQFIST